MAVVERVLLGPGPSNPYPEATAAAAAPRLGHLDPDFLGILDATRARLRAAWRTGKARTLPISGTGSARMGAPAGIRVDIDRWGVDVSYSGTQKCVGVAPGLAPFTLSERAWERRVARPQSWYLDLGLVGKNVGSQGGRKCHHTAPAPMVRSLDAGLLAALAEVLGR